MRWLKILRLVFAATLVLLCSACVPVLVNVPAGDKPVQLHSYNWEGIWMPYNRHASAGSFLMANVTVVDAEKGWLRAEFTTAGKEGLQVIVTDLYLRRAGRWMLLSMRWPELPGAASFKGYLWGRVELNHDTLLVWAPRMDRFYELVQKGEIEGRMLDEHSEKKSNARLEIERLDTSKLEWLQAVESMPADYWLAPMIYVRIAGSARIEDAHSRDGLSPSDAQSGEQ